MSKDTNQDGNICVKEAVSAKLELKWMNRMTNIDRNQDTQISRKELHRYLEIESRKQTSKEDLTIKMKNTNKIISRVFSNQDKNKDGFIVYSEFKKGYGEL